MVFNTGSIALGGAKAPGVGDAGEGAVGLNVDRLNVAESLQREDLVTEVLEPFERRLGEPTLFDRDTVWQVLMVHPRGGNDGGSSQAVIDDVRDRLEGGGDDRRTARRTGHQQQLALCIQHDRWRHR